MKVDFSNKQYENLVRLAMIGSTVIKESEDDLKEINQANDLIKYLRQQGKLPHNLAENVDEVMYAYSNEVFWDELSARLTERDILKQYSIEQVEAMSEDELSEIDEPIREMYENEFEANGLDSLIVKY